MTVKTWIDRRPSIPVCVSSELGFAGDLCRVREGMSLPDRNLVIGSTDLLKYRRVRQQSCIGGQLARGPDGKGG